MRKRRRGRLLLALGTLVFAAALGADVGEGVVQAVAPEAAQPRVTATVHSPPAGSLRKVVTLPFVDAPRSPGTGELAGAAFRRVLEARGIEVATSPAPLDSLGNPVPAHLVSPAQLLRIGQQGGADAVVTGRTVELHVAQRERPYLTVRTPATYLDLPAEVRVRTSASVSLRVLDTRRGRVAYEASARYGPAEDLHPEAALELLCETALAPWFSAPTP